MEIIQIVSRLPPAVDGVGDYAFLLAMQLRKEYDIQTTFVVCGKEQGARREEQLQAPSSKLQAPAELDCFPVHQLRERSSAELLRVLSAPGMPQTVLLQYVGYGYQKRGCPVWLVRALRAWKNGKGNAETLKTENLKSVSGCQDFSVSDFKDVSARPRLITMFHELYATGRPWQSSFWTSNLQRWIAQTLARKSDHCFTNRAASATWLATASQHPINAISVLPVFSNVGEPEGLPDWEQRKPRMIVFGSAGWRRNSYFEHRADLEQACQRLELTEIVDIGADCEIPNLSVPVRKCGPLQAAAVSQEMLSARAGFFAYPTPYLGKSGTFAAYAAHGLAPVTFAANRGENQDGLKAGEHYLFAGAAERAKAVTVAGNVHGWYRDHDTKALADCQARRIQILAKPDERMDFKMSNSLQERRMKAAIASKGTSSDAIYRLALKLLIKRPPLNGNLLEYGAGTGSLITRLLRLGYSGKVTGADILPKPEFLAGNATWIQGDLNGPLDLPGESFDVIISTEVIEHLENPRATFREFYRLLKPAGTIIVTTPNQESIRSLLGLLLVGHFVSFLDSSYPAHITALVRKDFERICLECGFSPPVFYFTDSGGIPKLPHIQWQSTSFGILKGRLFSDNLALVAQKR